MKKVRMIVNIAMTVVLPCLMRRLSIIRRLSKIWNHIMMIPAKHLLRIDCAVVVGNPAKVVKMLEAGRF